MATPSAEQLLATRKQLSDAGRPSGVQDALDYWAQSEAAANAAQASGKRQGAASIGTGIDDAFAQIPKSGEWATAIDQKLSELGFQGGASANPAQAVHVYNLLTGNAAQNTANVDTSNAAYKAAAAAKSKGSFLNKYFLPATKALAVGGAMGGIASAYSPFVSSLTGLSPAGATGMNAGAASPYVGAVSKASTAGSVLSGGSGGASVGYSGPGVGTMVGDGVMGGASTPFTAAGGLAGAIGEAGAAGAGSAGATSLSSFFPSFLGGTGSNPSRLGTALSIGSNLYSALAGNAAAKKQTQAMTDANNAALGLQARMYDQTSTNMSPFLASGTSANRRLSDLLGTSENTGSAGYGSLTTPFSMASFQADPGYQFRLEQGTKAMNQSLGARGSLFSGDALKATQSFGQGLADQTYNDAYNRYNQDQGNLYNRLNTQAAAGQNAAGNLGASGAQYANQASDLYQNQGNIQAGGIQAGQNVMNQSLASILGGNVGGFTGTQGLTQDQIIQLKRQLGIA